MESYQRPYFRLFSAICDTIEELELFLKDTPLSKEKQLPLQTQIIRLKQVQQATEFMLLAEPPNILLHRLK